MISEKVFTILIILAVIITVIYCYYNCEQHIVPVSRSNQGEYIITPKQTIEQFNSDNNTLPVKKVRFNDKVEYNYYYHPNAKTTKIKNRFQTPYAKQNETSTEESDSKTSECGLNVDQIISETNLKPKVNLTTHIQPANLEIENDKWDSSFGIPLMSQQEQSDYFVKMMDNHKKFDNSIGEFYEYVTDQSTILKTDITIDPFKMPTRSNGLKGKAIADIYDEEVKGPEAKPKKIKYQNGDITIYDNESSNNGGKIPGTNLFGFTSYKEQPQSAMFGNGFLLGNEFQS